MNRVTFSLICFSLVLGGIGGCRRGSTPRESASASPAPQMQMPMGAPSDTAPAAEAAVSGTVLETMDASDYTYVRVKTAKGEIWAAAGKFKVAVGDKVSVPLNMQMDNFHSNSLNRTFPVIYFAARITTPGAKPN